MTAKTKGSFSGARDESRPTDENVGFIWATRGRTWGFRFLRTGGLQDPLGTYEAIFSKIGGWAAWYRHRCAVLPRSITATLPVIWGTLIPARLAWSRTVVRFLND